MALSIDPSVVTFPASGGAVVHRIVSKSEARHAFKVKSSNNEHYRVRPVYGFVDGQQHAELAICRSEGPAKTDKLLIEWTEVTPEETDPKAPFTANNPSGVTILRMKAE